MKLMLTLFLGLVLFQNYSWAVDNTKKFMTELGPDLDIAESTLRIALDKPTASTCDRKLNAVMALMNFEMRHPGYLQGKYGKSDWAQYENVRDLYEQMATKYEFFFPQQKKIKADKAGKK